MLVEQSTEGGSLLKQDARLLEGVFEFSEKTAQEVMTPRTQIVALEADLPVEDAADEVAAAGRSRYPVYTDSLDEIVGRGARQGHPGRAAVPPGQQGPRDHASAALRARHPGGRGRAGRHEAAQDSPGGRARRVRRHRRPGDDGGPARGDRRPDLRRVRSAGEGAPRTGAPQLDGAMPITEFNSEYGETLDDTDYTTIGGYVFGQLGRLPRVGRPGARRTARPRGRRDGGAPGEDPSSPHPEPQAEERDAESPVADRASRAS